MYIRTVLFLLALVIHFFARAQNRKTENVVIVTLDGMRWQEVFGGADSVLMNDPLYSRNRMELREKFWSVDVQARREKLFPFFWNTIAGKGQIYGNRLYGNKVDVTNPYRFSYPGYNEMFTGYPDTAVNSNNKVWNKNVTVLEYINRQKGYKGKVAAFASWDVFPYILNRKRSGIIVNADMDTLPFNAPGFRIINDMQILTPKPVDLRPDVLTYMAAREYLKQYKPKVLYIAFDETDDFAHDGLYDQYLKSAYSQDAMIADLWKTLQSIPKYRDKTTLLITTDHGRGDKIKAEWKDHGKNIEDAGSIWIAVMGPDTKPMGEAKQEAQLYQRQIASTIAFLLGLDFKPSHEVMAPIHGIAGD